MREVRRLRRWLWVALLPAVLACVLVGVPARAQQVTLGKEAYLTPPKEIADAVVASRGENLALTHLSPDGKKFLVTKSDGLPPLQRMACPCVHLAEMAFDPVACRSRDLWVRSADGFELFYYADKRTVPVQVPGRARVSNPVWSPDGSRLAFFAHFEDATHIYVADAETGSSRRLTATPVLATLVTSFQWSRDGKQIQTVLLPDDGKREAPRPNGVATEPKVRVARGGNNPSRTYRYLLESPYDMKTFCTRSYFTGSNRKGLFCRENAGGGSVA
jgi:dipeptidyl aminopeptidase/acylaminoacyl peptidase